MDDGILFICRLDNLAEDGDMPCEKLAKINRHWYEERVIGMNRQYLAKGVNEQIDLLVRIHHDRNVRIGMFAVLGNGEQFRITNVSHITDGLRYTDLTLERLDEFYDVAGDD